MEEIEWYVKAKLDPEGHTDRVLIKQRGEYRVFVRERTCHNLSPKYGEFLCSECRDGLWTGLDDDEIAYCPNCGARVVKGV